MQVKQELHAHRLSFLVFFSLFSVSYCETDKRGYTTAIGCTLTSCVVSYRKTKVSAGAQEVTTRHSFSDGSNTCGLTKEKPA